MRHKAKQTSLKYLKAGAFLLVVLFVSISFVQAFHGHQKAVHIEHAADGDQVAGSDHCMVCDYYAQNQYKYFNLPHPVAPLQVITKVLTLNTHVIAGNYAFTLQGFTNKGPPSLIS